MAKDGEAMKRKTTPKKLKPGTRVPKFSTHAEEEKFASSAESVGSWDAWNDLNPCDKRNLSVP